MLQSRTDPPDAQDRLAGEWRDDDPGEPIDLRAIWAALFRNRFIILAIVAFCGLAGIAIVWLSPSIYRARASVQIDQQATKVLGTEETEPFLSGTEADRFLQTQVDILRSRALAARVADRLGLAANDTFLTRTTGRAPEGLDFARRREAVLATLQQGVRIDLPRDSRVVSIFFDSPDPTRAAQIANSYSQEFIASNIQRKFTTTDYSRQFLQGQLAAAKSRLEKSERELITYARASRTIDASNGATTVGGQSGPRSLTTANLVQLNESYAAAQSGRLLAQQRWEQAARTPVMALPEVLSNSAIQQLLQTRATLTTKVSQLRERLQPDHPNLRQANAETAEIDGQIATLANSLRASIRNQYLTALRQEEAVGTRVGSLKSSTLEEQGRSVGLNVLQREVDTNRQLYDSMLQRFKEVSAQAGVVANNVTVIDEAEAPREPISPRPLRTVLAALLTGVALALATVFARERLDDSMRDPQDMEVKLDLPLLAVVPVVSGQEVLTELARGRSDVAEAYHAARSSIELTSSKGLHPSLLVTSSRKGEGKSTTSFALARDFAGVGRRVLLIDADLRKPSLHSLLDRPRGDTGLSSVLAQMTEVGAAIQRTAFPNLSFLPAGPLPPNPAQLLDADAVGALLSALQVQFDLIVIDAPPVLALADAIQLASCAGATIFVVEAGGAHRGQAKVAVRRLRAGRANIIGGMVTKYDAKAAGYGYGPDYYSYRYENAKS